MTTTVVRESLPDLLRELGLRSRRSHRQKSSSRPTPRPDRCLIRHRHARGCPPRSPAELTRREQEIPIIFITAHGDETVRPRVIEQGAVECLFKLIQRHRSAWRLNAALRMTNPQKPSAMQLPRGYGMNPPMRTPQSESTSSRPTACCSLSTTTSGAGIAGIADPPAGWQPETFASAQGIPRPPTTRCSELLDT
jgi:DNA-binding NtrC family response regulator